MSPGFKKQSERPNVHRRPIYKRYFLYFIDFLRKKNAFFFFYLWRFERENFELIFSPTDTTLWQFLCGFTLRNWPFYFQFPKAFVNQSVGRHLNERVSQPWADRALRPLVGLFGPGITHLTEIRDFSFFLRCFVKGTHPIELGGDKFCINDESLRPWIRMWYHTRVCVCVCLCDDDEFEYRLIYWRCLPAYALHTRMTEFRVMR